MASTDNQKLYKVLVIGDSNTKKTSIIKRYVHQCYSPHYRATVSTKVNMLDLRFVLNMATVCVTIRPIISHLHLFIGVSPT